MIEDQPPPVRNERRASWLMVMDDMLERHQIGIERYGTPLQAFNGRDQLVDAYQEVLDTAVYLRSEITERGELRAAAKEYRDASWAARFLEDEGCDRLDPRWNEAVERNRRADARLAALLGESSPYAPGGITPAKP